MNAAALVASPGFAFHHRDRDVEVPEFVLAAGDGFCLVLPSAVEADVAARVLLGFEEPLAGHVELFGVDVTRAPPHRRLALRRRLALAATDPPFLGTVPLLENLALPRRDRLSPPEDELQPVVLATLQELGVEPRGRILPRQFSEPERYLAGLARAVLAGPELLLIAEPPGALAGTALAGLAPYLDGLRGRGVALLGLGAGRLNALSCFANIVTARVVARRRDEQMQGGR